MNWPTAVFYSVATFSAVLLILGIFSMAAQRSLDEESKKREDDIRRMNTSPMPMYTKVSNVTPEEAQKAVNDAIKRQKGESDAD